MFEYINFNLTILKSKFLSVKNPFTIGKRVIWSFLVIVAVCYLAERCMYIWTQRIVFKKRMNFYKKINNSDKILNVKTWRKSNYYTTVSQ